MAPSYDSLRLRNQREIDDRLTELHRGLAERIALEIIRAASADGLIANDIRTREALRLAIWEKAIKPTYIGSGTDALVGAEPQSPFARLLVAGIEKATRIQAERQAALVRRVVRDPEVADWLLGPQDAGILTLPAAGFAPSQVAGIAFSPTRDVLGGLRGPDGRIDAPRATAALVKPRGFHDPYYRWLDENGYRLSDRIWRTSIEVRARIDALLSYEIANGTSAVSIAKMLEPFLTPEAATQKSKKPYGTTGSHAARRLARTEITVASHRATVDAAIVNPFVNGVQWRLSASHPRIDICDDLARGGPNGDGIYPLDQVPSVPHPHCCTPGQLVQTRRGLVPIEQVADGDLVLTHKGRYRRMLAAWATPHDGPVYAFETERGSFELTGNHPVLTRRGWVNAECVQLGDQVLYAGVTVAANGPTAIANGDPAERGESIVPQVVMLGVAPMPARAIALNGNLEINESEIHHVGSDAKLLNESKSVAAQSISHPDLQFGARNMATVALHGTESLGFVALFDLERLPALLTDDCDAAVDGVMLLPVGEVGKARIADSFGCRDFTGDFGTLGRVAVAGEIEAQSRLAHLGAGGNAARTVVLLPTGGNGIAHGPHGDIMQGEQVAKLAIGQAVLLEDFGTGETLFDVDIPQQGDDGSFVFGLEAQRVEFRSGQSVDVEVATEALQEQAADWASNHDNLLSLSPVDPVGRESGNSLVGGVITPAQALTNCTPIRAIRQRHYTGPVYNMEVADDHSYTVNGAAVHNCLCSQLPVPMGSTADLVASLRADIQAARGNLIDAASGGNAARAEALRGTLNPAFLTQAMMSGTLEESILGVIRPAQEP